ncbi:MAG: putative adenylyltransferase/sulfurtransferase MoeZ [Candidatus Heimdallarchaeota archaeon LC_3]|nr:MAG: putative adenylyltransferase/sulfurtransferase MoeZ [Candidatus Heimdallarchaeota archaeon LC_3]
MISINSMTPTEAKENFDGFNFIILDVREKNEFDFVNIKNSIHIPMMSIPNNLNLLSKERDIGVLCHHGNRSAKVTAYLKNLGYNAFNISGGIEKWATETNKLLPRYNTVFGRIIPI